jgi:hypothetical protein
MIKFVPLLRTISPKRSYLNVINYDASFAKINEKVIIKYNRLK